MNILLEELNKELFKQSEVSGVEPLPVSRILSPGEKMEKRDTDVTKFFDDKGGFTYQEFKSILTVSLGSMFGLGAPARKKISKFAAQVNTKDEKGDVKIMYDEYVETFFIYLYYQLFVKLFSKHELIIAKNQEAIKNAKAIMSKDVPESLQGDMEEGLMKLYRSFYSMFASSIADPTKIKDSKEAQNLYFEKFTGQNVRLYIDYPLSGFMEGAGAMKIKDFVDNMFDAVGNINLDDKSSKQITTIRVLSNFTEGGFDVVKFQDLLKQYPSFTEGQGPLKFRSTLEPVVSNVITELSSMDDLDDIGMGWAKGTKWEQYIKILCGIISLEEVSNKVKSAAKALRKEKSKYKQRLDVGEFDGGVYFINNVAFVMAAQKVPKFKDVIKGLDDAITNVFNKTQYFQNKKDKQLIEAMFVRYDETKAAGGIDSLKESEQKSLEAIMEMTDLIGQFGSNFPEALAQINLMLFRDDNKTKARLSSRNEQSVEWAMNNVGDFILDEIRKDKLNSFYPSNVVHAVKEIASTTTEFFKQAFEGPKDLQNLKKAFNDTFAAQFDFAVMDTYGGKPAIKMDDRVAIKFDTLDDFKAYVKNMCISMGSIMYHSKVAFGKKGTKDSRYKDYFNVLSWFIKSLKEAGKEPAVGSTDYPFIYLITPFFLEVVKYSFRTHVNEIEDILFEEDLIDKDLRDKIKKSHKMATMEDEEWIPLRDSLAAAIEEHLKKK